MMGRPGHSPIMLGGGGSGLIRTVLGSKFRTTNLTTYNLANFDIGNPNAARFLVAALTSRANVTGRSLDSITIGGLAAADLATATFSGGGQTIIASLRGVTVPTGTEADVVVNFSNDMSNVACTLYRLLTLQSTTPIDTDTDTSSSSRTVSMTVAPPSGGVALAAACFEGGASTDATWTQLTEDYDTKLENAVRHTHASKQGLAEGAITITCTRDDFNALECAGAAIVMR